MTSVLTMTKIVVGDVEAASAFYGAVCGFTVMQRIEDDSFCELILQAPAPGSAALVLITYKGEPLPAPGECVLVFETGDVAGFVARAVAAGGTIMHPPEELPALGLTYALVRDREGHVVEAIRRTPPA